MLKIYVYIFFEVGNKSSFKDIRELDSIPYLLPFTVHELSGIFAFILCSHFSEAIGRINGVAGRKEFFT